MAVGIELAAVLFGLGSAVIWGTGDFLGGLAARRASVLGVLIVAETSGLVLLLLAGLALGEPIPKLDGLGWAAAAGLSGTLGLGALYSGLARGSASIVAPVSAVVGAVLPALYGALTFGLPPPLTLLGFAVAIPAIGMASMSAEQTGDTTALWLAIVAGLGFGGFFILIHQAGQTTTFFPLVISRGVSVAVLVVIALVRGVSLPSRAALPTALASGFFDAGGNVLFLFSTQLGRLDVATILASLYPVSTVILSRIVLGERTSRLQQFGVLAAIAAVLLIAL